MQTGRLILVALSLIAFTSVASEDPSPSLVIEVFRHGARGPEFSQYDEAHYWGNNAGQLTSSGTRMHYLLGVALKNQYPKLLEKYDAEKIYARSTDMNRTIMSVYSHLYGIFQDNGPALAPGVKKDEAIPPYQSDAIQKTVQTLDNSYALPNNVQAVPIHVTTQERDNVLRPWSACPLANKWYADGMGDKESSSVYESDMKDVVSHLNEKGLKTKNIDELYAISDMAITNKFQGIALPAGITVDSQHFNDLNFLAEWVTIKSVDLFDDQKSLYALGLLNTIKDYMNGKINGTNILDFVFLSGHDTTLLSLLVPFNITTKDCFRENFKNMKENKDLPYPHCKFPVYASNLIFELYKAPEPYVVFKYNGNAVPFCGKEDNKCTLKEFESYIQKVTKSFTMSDYQNMCQLPIANNEKTYFWVVVLILLCIALTAGIIVIRKKIQVKDLELDQPYQSGNGYAMVNS